MNHLPVEAFGEISVGGSSPATGHALGASGAIEWLACIEALRRQILPPITHFSSPDDGVDIDFVTGVGRPASGLTHVVSNSFAFGGNNAVLVAQKWEGL